MNADGFARFASFCLKIERRVISKGPGRIYRRSGGGGRGGGVRGLFARHAWRGRWIVGDALDFSPLAWYTVA